MWDKLGRWIGALVNRSERKVQPWRFLVLDFHSMLEKGSVRLALEIGSREFNKCAGIAIWPRGVVNSAPFKPIYLSTEVQYCSSECSDSHGLLISRWVLPRHCRKSRA